MARIFDSRSTKGNTDRRAALAWCLAFVAGAAFLLALAVDGTLDAWLVAHRTLAITFVAKLVSRFLAWHWLIAAAAVAWVFAWRMRRHDWQRVLCAMIIAASLAGLSADLLRGLTGRTRPYSRAPQGFYGPRHESQWLIGRHEFNSFPSGHTATITAFVLPLVIWRRRYAAFLLVVPLVAAARVYTGAHHLSDVIAGAALAVVIALLVARRFVVSIAALPKDSQDAWKKP
jgi:membrane-associated phospholipid phosphatase